MAMGVAKRGLVIRPPADLLDQQPGLRRMASELAQCYAQRQLVREEMLQAMGAALWRALDRGEALVQARAAARSAVLPVVIETSEPALLRLPWVGVFCCGGERYG